MTDLMTIALLVYFLAMFLTPMILDARKHIAGLQNEKLRTEIEFLKSQMFTPGKTQPVERMNGDAEMRLR